MYEFPSEYLCSDLIVTDGFIGSQYKFSIIPFFFYMPDYAPYGQENSFWFPIPSSLKLSSYWRVFQAFSLSYTLASRQFKPYFASFILFQMLGGLQRGYRHPSCALIPFSHLNYYLYSGHSIFLLTPPKQTVSCNKHTFRLLFCDNTF